MGAADDSRAPYRLGELLGQDELAELRAAEGPASTSVYARHYKLVSWSTEREERFRRLAEACRTLVDPSIAPVLGYGVSSDRPFVVYELRPAISLRTLLTHARAIPAPGAVWFLNRVAVALELAPAHAHGALTPDSILLGADGEVQVRDLGILSLATHDDLPKLKERVAAYVAPEVVDGAEPNASAGVFALGVCIYEALMGERPFRGKTPLANLVHARMGKFQRVEEERAPAELRELVHAMLAPDPGARPSLADLTRAGAKLAWRESQPATLAALVRPWIVDERPTAPPDSPDTTPSLELPAELREPRVSDAPSAPLAPRASEGASPAPRDTGTVFVVADDTRPDTSAPWDGGAMGATMQLQLPQERERTTDPPPAPRFAFLPWSGLDEDARANVFVVAVGIAIVATFLLLVTFIVSLIG